MKNYEVTIKKQRVMNLHEIGKKLEEIVGDVLQCDIVDGYAHNGKHYVIQDELLLNIDVDESGICDVLHGSPIEDCGNIRLTCHIDELKEKLTKTLYA